MTYGFDQFLNARSAYGAAVDAAGDRLLFISDLTGSPQLWALFMLELWHRTFADGARAPGGTAEVAAGDAVAV